MVMVRGKNRQPWALMNDVLVGRLESSSKGVPSFRSNKVMLGIARK